MSCGRTTPRDPMVDRLSDLLSRSGRGDQQAFAQLHAATQHKLRKTAAAVSPFTTELDDLVQDAYLKIWRHASGFDPRRASPITWMCAIMRNTAIDALRARKIRTEELDEAMPAADTADPDDFDYELAQSIAAPAIRKLADDRRQLLSLAYLEGESRVVLAQRFGVPVGTIKTWLRRTLQALRHDCRAGEMSVHVVQAG